MKFGIVYWNIKGKSMYSLDIQEVLIELMKDNDLLVLAEPGADQDKILKEELDLLLVPNPIPMDSNLKRFTPRLYTKSLYLDSITIRADQIIEEAHYKIDETETEPGRFVAFEITGYPIVFSAVHLKSLVKADEFDKLKEAEAFMEVLVNLEANNNSRAIVFGDFNMAPFARAMVDQSGFFGFPRLRDLETKKVGFYNPCFGLLGDQYLDSGNEKVPGSYYYEGARPGWTLIDQVIMRKEIGRYFDFKSLKIITEVNNINLTDKNGRPDSNKYSDHFPLQFSLNLNHDSEL